MLKLLIPLVLFAVILLPLASAYKASLKGKKSKKGIVVNLASFAVFSIVMIAFVFANPAAAAETAKAASSGLDKSIGLLAAALAMGIPGIGAGLAIASSATSAIGATSEDPKMLGRSIIFVALGESIALFGFIIAFMIITKI